MKDPEAPSQAAKPPVDPTQKVGAYPWYALTVLSMVYMLNFLDRQILSILAEAIKADLGVSDAQLGFLYGTAFAVFYAVFGIPLARLSDVWIRKNVIAIGLAVWSLMTALSGTARSALSLGAYRIGVGVGESSATPAAYAALSDYFPERLRATALSLYAGGLYVGQGLGFFIGGYVLDRWDASFADGIGWFGLRGWQAALFIVGLPGLLLAIWVYTLREPVRGGQEGFAQSEETERPGRMLLGELATVVPPFTIWSLRAAGASRQLLAANLGVALGLMVAAALLVWLVGEAEQWIALAVGIYATVSWVQGLSLRDRPTYVMLFRSATLWSTVVGLGWSSFLTYSFMFWMTPYLQRSYQVGALEVGQWLMFGTIGGGIVGVTLGGMISDALKRRFVQGRLYLILTALLLHIPAALLLLWAPSLGVAYLGVFLFYIFNTSWVGSATAVVTELVLPRMRAVASALLLLMYTFLGLALGPFAVGRLSDQLGATGFSQGEALGRALLCSLGVLVICTFYLLRAMRTIEEDEASILQRARRAGEPV